MLPKIPDELTEDGWDRNKGKIATMAGATGMGVALKQLEVEWNKADFEDVEQHVSSAHSIKDKYTASRLAFEAWHAASKLRQELVAVHALAANLVKKWGKSLIISKSSVKYVTKITNTSQHWIEELDKHNATHVRAEHLYRQAVQAEIKKPLGMLKSVKDPTTYDKMHTALCLFQIQAVQSPDEDLKHWADNTGKKLTAEDHKPKKDKDVAGKVKDVKLALDHLNLMYS